jgi:cell division initiation protein
MKLSPISIRKQEFGRNIRGYNIDEVQAFLEKLSDEVESLLKENERLKRELDEANSRLSEFRKIEKNLQNALLKAQDNSTRSIESAKRQTSLMIKEAEIKASQILEKARENANEIRKAVINLREERDLIVAKLKSIINSQAHLLHVKVEEAGEEPLPVKEIETQKKISVDIENIVNKIL